MAYLQTDSVPSVDRVGDVVGVQFSDEDELAVFIPSSGDVLLCTASQWRSLKDVLVVNPTGSLTAPLQSGNTEGSAPAADLKSTLLSLGACLA